MAWDCKRKIRSISFHTEILRQTSSEFKLQDKKGSTGSTFGGESEKGMEKKERNRGGDERADK